jgi:hypothetical protein
MPVWNRDIATMPSPYRLVSHGSPTTEIERREKGVGAGKNSRRVSCELLEAISRARSGEIVDDFYSDNFQLSLFLKGKMSQGKSRTFTENGARSLHSRLIFLAHRLPRL